MNKLIYFLPLLLFGAVSGAIGLIRVLHWVPTGHEYWVLSLILHASAAYYLWMDHRNSAWLQPLIVLIGIRFFAREPSIWATLGVNDVFWGSITIDVCLLVVYALRNFSHPAPHSLLWIKWGLIFLYLLLQNVLWLVNRMVHTSPVTRDSFSNGSLSWLLYGQWIGMGFLIAFLVLHVRSRWASGSWLEDARLARSVDDIGDQEGDPSNG